MVPPCVDLAWAAVDEDEPCAAPSSLRTVCCVLRAAYSLLFARLGLSASCPITWLRRTGGSRWRFSSPPWNRLVSIKLRSGGAHQFPEFRCFSPCTTL